MSKSFVIALSAAAVVAAVFTSVMAAPQPQVVGGYEFPAETEFLLSNTLDTSFTCEGKDYNYYADPANNCQVFHVCLPVTGEDGVTVVEYKQWSFICGNQTIFDQSTLTCNYPQDAFPCEEAPSLYGAIEFGKIEE